MGTDDLTRPVGLDRPAPSRRRHPARRLVLPGLVLGASLAGLYLAIRPDATGRSSRALVPITEAPAPKPDPAPSPAQRADSPAAKAADPRREGSAIEDASGVSVVRPDGEGAPESLVIRIPDAVTTALPPAPDPRLVERGRYGPLPKIGADGARPLTSYARPVPPPVTGGRQVRIALMVGGLGLNDQATASAIDSLPPAVTLGFAPYGQALSRDAARARESGHEIMLQVPMEPFGYPVNDPGPRTLTAGASPADNLDRLRWLMSRFTGYTGIVNFMGARFTGEESALSPILREAGSRGLAFLDDGSSARSLVERLGPAARIPTARADIALDDLSGREAIDRALEQLEAIAREKGIAIATASALPDMVERLARWSRNLEDRGIVLVPVSATFRERGER